MRILQYIILLVSVFALTQCISTRNTVKSKLSTEPDSTIFSFTFLGCNRVDYPDKDNAEATNGSMANIKVLKRIFAEMTALKQKPELFFFLGDMVFAENTHEDLENQLTSWVAQYKDTAFSKMAESGIEMVAIPGNHEMLYYKKYKKQKAHEWPLKGATEIWMKHMAQYMPNDRDAVTGIDSLINQMTFSFIRHNVGFVCMNTDTYNAPTKDNPYGLEGMTPTQWIVEKVNEYQQDSTIDHVFVLGHKPYYVSGKPQTGHVGIPEGPVLWPKLNDAHVVAMLSAHLHEYQRDQPADEGTYQVIAGNGGSKGTADFFGYSIINILASGEVELISKGFDVSKPYYGADPSNPSTVRDSTHLTWSTNGNPYKNSWKPFLK